MDAEVLGPRDQRFRMQLSPGDGLVAPHDAPADFDSTLESEVDAAWNRAPVDGWDWKRESELLVHGQTVMTPDFTLTHSPSGLIVYVEVIGFWTPEYLEEKFRRLKMFSQLSDTGKPREKAVKWLLIVPKDLKPDRHQTLADLEFPIIRFDKKSDPQSWIDALQPD